jgi:hypothetical protein
MMIHALSRSDAQSSKHKGCQSRSSLVVCAQTSAKNASYMLLYKKPVEI